MKQRDAYAAQYAAGVAPLVELDHSVQMATEAATTAIDPWTSALEKHEQLVRVWLMCTKDVDEAIERGNNLHKAYVAAQEEVRKRHLFDVLDD